MPTIDRAGAQIYYEALGKSGPWVTLINGHTRSSSDFRLLSQKLQDQAFRPLLVDNRGSGRTRTDREFALEDMIADVAAIWDQLRIETSAVLGISMGGVIAQYLARDFSEKIDKLILVSTTSNVKYVDLSTKWGDTFESVHHKLQTFFAKEFVTKNKILVDAMVKQILGNIQEGKFEKFAQWQRLAVDGHYQTKDFLSDFEKPCLVIHGDADIIIQTQAAYDLKAQLSNAKLEIFTGAGHLLLAERPRELEKMIIEFLKN